MTLYGNLENHSRFEGQTVTDFTDTKESTKLDTIVPVLLTSKGAAASSAPDVMAIHTGRLLPPSGGKLRSSPVESIELATISAVAVVLVIGANTVGRPGALPADRVSREDVSPVHGGRGGGGRR